MERRRLAWNSRWNQATEERAPKSFDCAENRLFERAWICKGTKQHSSRRGKNAYGWAEAGPWQWVDAWRVRDGLIDVDVQLERQSLHGWKVPTVFRVLVLLELAVWLRRWKRDLIYWCQKMKIFFNTKLDGDTIIFSVRTAPRARFPQDDPVKD